jgi:hypothetical protein
MNYMPGGGDPCIGIIHTVASFWRLALVTCALAGFGVVAWQPGDACEGDIVFTQKGDVCVTFGEPASYDEFKRLYDL